jgi:hypothetical protein
MKPLLWMRAVRDARPTVARLAVLLCLALRMRLDGSGYASERQLADDAMVTDRTVRRSTQWARDAGYLNRTRRGHRRGDGTVIASEWMLTDPSQPVTRALLSAMSTGQQGPIDGGLNRTRPPSQPDSGAAPEVYDPEIRGPSHREPQGPAAVDAGTTNPIDKTEAELAAARRRECHDCGRSFARRIPADQLCTECRGDRRRESA